MIILYHLHSLSLAWPSIWSPSPHLSSSPKMRLMEPHLTYVSPQVEISSLFFITVRKLKSNQWSWRPDVLGYFLSPKPWVKSHYFPLCLLCLTLELDFSFIRTHTSIPLLQGRGACCSLGPEYLSLHGSHFSIIQIFSNVNLSERPSLISPHKKTTLHLLPLTTS